MTTLFAFSLWGQQGRQGGPGMAELIQALVVLLFVFGPALLQLFFGKKKEQVKKEKGQQAAPPVEAAPRPATPPPIHQEIDDFIRNRSDHIERTEQRSQPRSEQRTERGEGNRTPRREKRPRPSRVPTPVNDAVAASSAHPLAASALISSERSTAQHYGSDLASHPIAAMLHSPNSLAHAVVLSEILRRPNF